MVPDDVFDSAQSGEKQRLGSRQSAAEIFKAEKSPARLFTSPGGGLM